MISAEWSQDTLERYLVNVNNIIHNKMATDRKGINKKSVILKKYICSTRTQISGNTSVKARLNDQVYAVETEGIINRMSRSG